MPEPVAPALAALAGRPQTGARSIADMALKIDPTHPPAVGRVRQPPLKKRLSRKVGSCPLPVPRTDWEKVTCGVKPMFRTYSGSWRDRNARLFRADEEFPRPALIYSYVSHHPKRIDTRLAVIIDYRREPLGAISSTDLVTEGFSDVRAFQRYWRLRYPKVGWRPLDLISVVELRPWEPDDREIQAGWLLQRLYGEWM